MFVGRPRKITRVFPVEPNAADRLAEILSGPDQGGCRLRNDAGPDKDLKDFLDGKLDQKGFDECPHAGNC